MPGDQIVKAGLHDVVWQRCRTKVFTQRRACPSHSACFGQHRQLKRREVAQTYKLRTFVNGFGQCFVVDVCEDSGQAVATARDQCHIRTTCGRPVNGCKAGRVVSGKTLVFGQSRLVDFDVVPQGLQTFDASFKARFVTHCTGR